MGYLRGFSERGIDYDAGTQTFTLERPSSAAEKFLDANFDRLEGGRWKIRAQTAAQKVGSFVRAVASGTAPPEVVQRRRKSCLSCPALLVTSAGSFCTACNCGRWLFAKLDGTLAPKLAWATLDCPLKRPGFSNEVPS